MTVKSTWGYPIKDELWDPGQEFQHMSSSYLFNDTQHISINGFKQCKIFL